MNKNKTREIPRSIKNHRTWEASRRSFLKNSIAIGALAQMSFLQGCINKETDATTVLNKKQLEIATLVQQILFPKEANSPGAKDFNAAKYLLWVLTDKRIPKDEKQYIVNGLKWVNETAQEENSSSFLKLSKNEQVQVIDTISNTSWGENWLSVMLTFIIEAMISDPIYGFNKDGIGTKWLGHQVGYPRPTKENRYDEIFDTLSERNTSLISKDV